MTELVVSSNCAWEHQVNACSLVFLGIVTSDFFKRALFILPTLIDL